MTHRTLLLAVLACLAPAPAPAQTAANLAAVHGLAPATALAATPVGHALMAENLRITAAIQAGAVVAPSRLSFPEQQAQALRDAFITGWNAAGMADGLGTTLAAAYRAKAAYDTPERFTSLSPVVANLIAYTNETTASDSNAAKYILANGTLDGTRPAAPEALELLRQAGGAPDFIGRAYARPAGTPGADPFGNPRPFQTLPALAPIAAPDYFGKPSTNAAYLRGPEQDLTASPAFPSGHTTYGTMEAVLLGLPVPDRYAQQVVRAAEYGNDRIVLGAHYAIDVIAGRALALHDLAHLLANDPAYVGQKRSRATPITDYPKALADARADMTAALADACAHPIPDCARNDAGRFADPALDDALIAFTQTYGLPIVYIETAGAPEDVARLAPEAGYLLTAAFPSLTLAEADAILTATEGPGGGFLDNGSPFGVYSRLNLYAAIKAAQAKTP